MNDFSKLDFLNLCGLCESSIIDSKCHICNNTKKYRKYKYEIQKSLEALFSYKLVCYLNQEILPEYSSLEFDYVCKPPTKVLKRCILIDVGSPKTDIIVRKLYNLINLSISYNFSFYYILVDMTRVKLLANFLTYNYPKITDKTKHYIFGNNVIVNKSRISMAPMVKIIKIFNNKLSITIKQNEHIILRKLHIALLKKNSIGIRTLNDLKHIETHKEYSNIYSSIETLLRVLAINGYKSQPISSLLFEENMFTLTKKPTAIILKRLALIKYQMKDNTLQNESLLNF